MKRFGIFGGSFDPVHLGHLQLAQQCQQQGRLDEVRFLPTATQPLKTNGPVATSADRCAMLQLALADEPTWRVDRLEIDRGGLSYTVDTLRQLHEDYPKAELFFLMGADSLHDFPKWREPAEILALATLLVVARAGEPAPHFQQLAPWCSPEHIAAMESLLVKMPAMPVASSTLRQRIAQGKSIEGEVPVGVAQYIRDHRLYA